MGLTIATSSQIEQNAQICHREAPTTCRNARRWGVAGPATRSSHSWPMPPPRVMRFNPGNAHVCGLSRHGALVGSGKLDGDQTKAGGHKVYPGSTPLVG
jgi:hypothetical protein